MSLSALEELLAKALKPSEFFPVATEAGIFIEKKLALDPDHVLFWRFIELVFFLMVIVGYVLFILNVCNGKHHKSSSSASTPSGGSTSV